MGNIVSNKVIPFMVTDGNARFTAIILKCIEMSNALHLEIRVTDQLYFKTKQFIENEIGFVFTGSTQRVLELEESVVQRVQTSRAPPSRVKEASRGDPALPGLCPCTEI